MNDKQLERRKQWLIDNKERIAAVSKVYQQNNKDKTAKANKKYYNANKIKLAAKRKASKEGKQAFEASYIFNSNITIKEYRRFKSTVKCDCGEKYCDGWWAKGKEINLQGEKHE